MSDYLSEIRPSTIRDLEEKVDRRSYGKYLNRMILRRLRGFTDREVTFDFPVTALVGPNGGGKTTVMGAAALVYRSVPPSRFFAKSGRYDASMKDWAVEYELTDQDLSPRLPVQRTASFRELKWNRKAVRRNVLIFGVSRTVPATERRELVKAVGSRFTAAAEVTLTDEVTQNVEKILGKEIQGYNRLSVDKGGRVTLFAAATPAGDEYS